MKDRPETEERNEVKGWRATTAVMRSIDTDLDYDSSIRIVSAK